MRPKFGNICSHFKDTENLFYSLIKPQPKSKCGTGMDDNKNVLAKDPERSLKLQK